MHKRLLFTMVLCAAPAFAQQAPMQPIPADDYFKKSLAINAVRKVSNVTLSDLPELMKDKNTVIIDVRGDADYKAMHISGAKHLSLSDMKPDTLAKVIPSTSTRVILYCDAALTPFPTRRVALSTEAYPLVYMHGYTNLHEVSSLWGSDEDYLHKQYEAYLALPFDGDAAVIAADKELVKKCLASNGHCP